MFRIEKRGEAEYYTLSPDEVREQYTRIGRRWEGI